MATALYNALAWLRRNPRSAWMILLVYAATVTFPHEQVQTAVAKVAQLIGRANLYRVAGGIGLILGAALTAIFLLELRRRTFRGLIGGYWAATFLLIFGTWSLLTANNTELVHYPQYFVPAVILMTLTLSPLESLSWILITGGLDECYQYWALHGSWAIPFDFNDVFMDFLGGALGVVFALAFLPSSAPPRENIGSFLRRIFSKPGAAILLTIVTSGAILWACGKMLLYADEQNRAYWFALSRKRSPSFWFFDETWGPKTFHTLSPLEGSALIVVALAFYTLLNRKLNISPPDERCDPS